MICIQYEPTKVSVSNHSEGVSSVARFNEAMKYLSMAISDPGHCKVLPVLGLFDPHGWQGGWPLPA